MTRYAWVIAIALACGGKTSSSTAKQPSGGSGAAGDACAQAGGKCVANTAEVACASQPANACSDGQVCCVMAAAAGDSGW